MANSILNLAVQQVLGQTSPEPEKIPLHWSPWATVGVRGVLRELRPDFYRVMMEDSELLHLIPWEGKKLSFWEVLADISFQRYQIRRKEILSVLAYLSSEMIESLSTVDPKMLWKNLELLIPEISSYQKKTKYNDVLISEVELRARLDGKVATDKVEMWLGDYTPATFEFYKVNGCPIDNRFVAMLTRTQHGRYPVQVPRHCDLSPLPEVGEEVYIFPTPAKVSRVADNSAKPRTTWLPADQLAQTIGNSPIAGALYPSMGTIPLM